jgi:hypothetical protein
MIRLFTVMLIILVFTSCNDKESQGSAAVQTKESSASFASNKKMAEELLAIANNKSDLDQWHLCKERAENYDKKAAAAQDASSLIQSLYQSSLEWLNAGEYDLSIARMEQMMTFVNENNVSIPMKDFHRLKSFLAVCYLRKGEIENCMANHNEYSCLLPIEKTGVHQNVNGVSKAQNILKTMYKEDPSNLKTKWLLNIAEMALGKYPNKVPSEYKIDEKVFSQSAGIKRFKDNAMGLDLAINDIAGSVIIDDFNNDNYLDIVTSSYGLDDQLQFFTNDGNGKFTNKTKEAKLEGQISGLNIMQADYNNDGYLDILILRGAWLKTQGRHPNSLLRNNQDGTFTDVTVESGLYCKFPTQTATWQDFNNDGWVDLFIGNESSVSLNAPCQLFQNNKDGSFTDVAADKRCNIRSFIKGCTAGDIDNDGDQDLFISSITGPNFLLENMGPEHDYKFKNISKTLDGRGMKSFPCWMFDYNQDGWQDIFVSGFDFNQFDIAAGEVAAAYLDKPTSAELPRLYKNLGNGSFTEVSKQTNVNVPLYTMGCNIGDINNDGYPDFYAATGTPDFSALIPNQMFLNNNGSGFQDVTHEAGLGHLQKGHGVAIADLDMDGDQDIYNVLGGSYDGDNFMNAMFFNENNENNWVKLKLIGTKANKAAIGSRIKLTLDNGQNVYRTVNSGGSFGANSLMQHIGLGSANTIKKVTVTWYGSGLDQEFTGLRSNGFYKLTEGIAEVNEVKTNSMDMISQSSDHGHHHHH